MCFKTAWGKERVVSCLNTVKIKIKSSMENYTTFGMF
jgi:hypothetical protein